MVILSNHEVHSTCPRRRRDLLFAYARFTYRAALVDRALTLAIACFEDVCRCDDGHARLAW